METRNLPTNERGVATLEYLGMAIAAGVIVVGVIGSAPDLGPSFRSTVQCVVDGGCSSGGPGVPQQPGGPEIQGGGGMPPGRGADEGGPTTGHEPGTKDGGAMPPARGADEGGPTTGHEPGTR